MTDAISATPVSPVDETSIESWARAEQRRRRARRRRRRGIVWTVRGVAAAVALALWQWVGSNTGEAGAITTSNPAAVFDYLVANWPTREFWTDIEVTSREAGLGFGLSAAAAFVAAFLLSLSSVVADAVHPMLDFLNSLPRIAFAPVFIAWFGLGERPQVVLVITLCFFVVLNGAVAGLSSVDADLRLLSRQLGAGRRAVFLKVTLPGSAPSVFGSLRLALIYSFLAAVTGEMLTGSVGAGAAIAMNSGLLNMDAVFGVLLTLGLVVTGAVGCLRLVERRALAWQQA